MRAGSNPLKEKGLVKEQQTVTVAVLNFIPFQSGYFNEGLSVLKLCLASIRRNTQTPFDLMVFDNGSTPEVIEYLLEERTLGNIDYLILSEANVGKGGAWNVMLKAAPGDYVAYTDGDVFFYPGWLQASLQIINTFPNVGMVTSMPMRHHANFNTENGLALARKDPGIKVESGKLLSDEMIKHHCQGVGFDFEKYMQQYGQIDDVLLTRDSVQAYVGASHFQFTALKSTLEKFMPFRVTAPLDKRDDRQLDISMNQANLLKLSTTQPLVYHLGNQLPDPWKKVAAEYGVGDSHTRKKSTNTQSLIIKIREIKLLKRSLLKIYNLIFDLYFRNDDMTKTDTK